MTGQKGEDGGDADPTDDADEIGVGCEIAAAVVTKDVVAVGALDEDRQGLPGAEHGGGAFVGADEEAESHLERWLLRTIQSRGVDGRGAAICAGRLDFGCF